MGSEDIRTAIIQTDPEYQEMAERVCKLECVFQLLEDYKRSFEMAYNVVKKVIDISIRSNPRLTIEGNPGTQWQ
jgi:hypothetical protein